MILQTLKLIVIPITLVAGSFTLQNVDAEKIESNVSESSGIVTPCGVGETALVCNNITTVYCHSDLSTCYDACGSCWGAWWNNIHQGYLARHAHCNGDVDCQDEVYAQLLENHQWYVEQYYACVDACQDQY